MFNDSLTNLAANMAIGNAKSVHDKFSLRALNDLELESMYRGEGIPRKVIDLPVRDMLRPWRSWQAEKDQISIIEDAEKRHRIRAKLAQAIRLGRLYGGAAILVGADVADPMKPLRVDAVKKGGLRYLTVLSRRMIGTGERDLDPESPTYGEPAYYRLSSQRTGALEVHPSRIIRFIGAERPDIDNNNDCWGDSILQVVYSALHAAALSHTGISELIHEAKVDVVRMDGLSETLATQGGTEKVTKWAQTANMLKSINNMLLLDKNDEWDRKQTTFAGLTDVLMAFMEIVAGVTDIPVTRLLGTSAKGLNATGEGDQKNYHEMLDSLRNDDLRPKLEFLDEILWRDATGAAAPKDVFFTFNPLTQMTATEKAALNKTNAETDQIYANMGMMPEEALAKGITNRLIENETYPGLEAAIEEEVGENGELVPEDPLLEAEIAATKAGANAKVQPAGNGPARKAPAKDRASTGDGFAGLRARLDRDIAELGEVYFSLGSGERH
jgi:phage-related protein (TIGR01555 family)